MIVKRDVLLVKYFVYGEILKGLVVVFYKILFVVRILYIVVW